MSHQIQSLSSELTRLQFTGRVTTHSNRVRRPIAASLLIGTVGLFLVGCDIEPEILAQIENASFQDKQISSTFDATSNNATSPARSNTEFTPAFPDREDPFHINQTEVIEIAQRTESSDIRVVGFANMGSQQAILKIADETQFVRVGDVIDDVEVINISPPRVRLKNGNFTWDVSMFTRRD